MVNLREEALQIVNDMPDYLLKALVDNLKHFKFRQIDSMKKDLNGNEIDPKKAAAFAAMEEWRYRNGAISESDIDLDKERGLAMEEKYGPLN